MRFTDYTQRVGGKLSAAKRAVLERLWHEGSGFPRGWVVSSELLRLTKQKYFDRRFRELRDNSGCDIETGVSRGEHAYRLRSPEILASTRRTYLAAAGLVGSRRRR